jgi:hypothetical protein
MFYFNYASREWYEKKMDKFIRTWRNNTDAIQLGYYVTLQRTHTSIVISLASLALSYCLQLLRKTGDFRGKNVFDLLDGFWFCLQV